jgi:hypothetical protein
MSSAKKRPRKTFLCVTSPTKTTTARCLSVGNSPLGKNHKTVLQEASIFEAITIHVRETKEIVVGDLDRGERGAGEEQGEEECGLLVDGDNEVCVDTDGVGVGGLETSSLCFGICPYQFNLYNIKDLTIKENSTFVTVNKKCINTLFDFSYKQLCFWQIFYDLCNFDCAKKKAIELYESGQLPGVSFLAYPIVATNEKQLLFFSGPIEDEQFLTYVGNLIVNKMRHTRQKCNNNYSDYIYCQRRGERYRLKVSY